MKLSSLKSLVPERVIEVLAEEGIENLLPAQEKAVKAGVLEGKNVLVCTPTASGKTLIAELAIMKSVLSGKGKAVYIVPLKSLANEKYKLFRKRYGSMCKVAISIGDYDSSETFLSDYDVIITTSEKLDSLTRHRVPWLSRVALMVLDEVHLLNDADRGPTLEVLITVMRKIVPDIQILSLSATIGNPSELADWLDSELVFDEWRPVQLYKGVALQNRIKFYSD
ncbi:DEAD/DEAH box helicase [Candidatus Woesearchaeota archaeon]|nr:MAG: DEAD/DEAH box helicase [Candidatus Woesearchaeota archaeon]